MAFASDANQVVHDSLRKRGESIEVALAELQTQVFTATPVDKFDPLFPFPPTTTTPPSGSSSKANPKLIRGVAMVQDIEDDPGFYEGNSNNFFLLPGGEDGGQKQEEEGEGPRASVECLQVYLVPVPGWLYGQEEVDIVCPSSAAERTSVMVSEVTRAQNRKRTMEEAQAEGDDDDIELDITEKEDLDAVPRPQSIIKNTNTNTAGASSPSEAGAPAKKRTRFELSQMSENSSRTNNAAFAGGPSSPSMTVPSNTSTRASLTMQLNLPHDAVVDSLQCAVVATVLVPNGGFYPKINDVVEVCCFMREDEDEEEPRFGGGFKEDGGVQQAQLNAHNFALMGAGSHPDDFAPWRCNNLPTSLVRTAICVSTQLAVGNPSGGSRNPTCPNLHSNSLRSTQMTPRLERPLITAVTTPDLLLQMTTFIKDRRAAALSWLQECAFANDPLVAQYVLAQMCSTVLNRVKGTPIGDLPVHLVVPQDLVGSTGAGAPPSRDLASKNVRTSSAGWRSTVRAITAAIRQVGANGSVSLTDQDRHRMLLPTKTLDDGANYLQSGLLQLSDGTHLLMDLTTVQFGDRLSWQEQTDGKEIEKILQKLEAEEVAETNPPAQQQRQQPPAVSHREDGEEDVDQSTASSVGNLLDNLVSKQILIYKYLYCKIEKATDIQGPLFISHEGQLVLAEMKAALAGVGTPKESSALKDKSVLSPGPLFRRTDYVADLHFTIPWNPLCSSSSSTTVVVGAQDEEANGAALSSSSLATLSGSAVGVPVAVPKHQVLEWRRKAQEYFAAVQDLVHLKPVLRSTPLPSISEKGGSHGRMAEMLIQEKVAHPARFNNSALIHNNTMSMRMSLLKAVGSSFGIHPENYDLLLERMQLPVLPSSLARPEATGAAAVGDLAVHEREEEASGTVWDFCMELEEARCTRCQQVVKDTLKV